MFRVIKSLSPGTIIFSLATLILCAWIPVGMTALGHMEPNDYSHTPLLSDEAYRKETFEINRLVDPMAPLGTPEDYFRTVARVGRFEHIERHYMLNKGSHETMNYFLHSPGYRMTINNLQTRYWARYGLAMQKVAVRMGPWATQQSEEVAPQGAFNMSSVLQPFLYAYLASVLLSIPFYALRLRQEGLRVGYEFASGRLPFFCLSGLLAAFLYPRFVNPVTQARRALQVAGGVIAGLISFGAMAGAAAAGERTGSEGEGGNSNVLVLGVSDLPKITGGMGIMSAKVTGNGVRVNDGLTMWGDLHVSYSNGFDLDVWSSHQAQGNGSNELDYTGSWTGTPFRWTPAKVTIGLGVYDLNPEGKATGGDMLSPFVGVELPLSHGLTGFAKTDGYVLTGGAPGRNGFDVVLGAKTTTHLRDVDFSHSASAVWGTGPFHQDQGTMLRLDEAASVALTKWLKATFTGKLFVPLWGPRGRKCDVSVGVGLSYAY